MRTLSKSKLNYLQYWNINIINRLKCSWITASLTLLTSCCFSLPALAEGSYQIGLNQPMYDYDGYGISLPLYVDILTAGEVINISLCGNGNTTSDRIRAVIYNPSGTQVYDSTSILPTVSCTSNLTSLLTTPIKYTTTVKGAYQLRLYNDNGTNFNRFDVTVTPNITTNPNPTVTQGRLHAFRWAFDAGNYGLAQAADTNYYTLVPGGRSGQNFVWLLDLNRFAGYVYDIIANNIGVNSPRSGLSTPRSGNSVNPLYPIYLGYPAVAGSRPTVPPNIANFRFIDNAGVDNSISPGSTITIQDSGTFQFNTDVDGTYAITIDTNQDGVYGAGDTLLLGIATSGANSVTWNGRNNSNNILPSGSYNAQLAVRLGEYHFIAADAETSGGGANNGLTIYEALSSSNQSDTKVFWDDFTLLSGIGGTSNLPNGALSSTPAGKHTWGNFTSTGFGNETYIDTYVYGDLTIATSPVIIDNSDEPRANSPDLFLVKRITAINPNQPDAKVFNNFVDDPNDSKDNLVNWPNNKNIYLRGEINVANVKPGDEVEYTIYFLSYGNQAAKTVKLCDFVPNSMTFVPNAYGKQVGIALGLDNTTPPANPNLQLSNLSDSDQGEFIAPNTTPPSFCKKPDPSNPNNLISANSNDNTSGIVLIKLNSVVPTALDPGVPPNSYGYVRFRATVK